MEIVCQTSRSALVLNLQQVSEELPVHSTFTILLLILSLTAEVDLGDENTAIIFDAHRLLSRVLEHVAVSIPLHDLLSVELTLRFPYLNNGHVHLLVDVHPILQVIGDK